jgi:hypothetical protein
MIFQRQFSLITQTNPTSTTLSEIWIGTDRPILILDQVAGKIFDLIVESLHSYKLGKFYGLTKLAL